MSVRKWIIGLVFFTGSFALLWIVWGKALRVLKEVNEPNPATFDRAIIERNLAHVGITAKVAKVLYVNLDDTTFIFEGELQSANPATWTRKGDVWSREPVGLLCHKGRIIGFSRGSTMEQPTFSFDAKWKKFAGN